MLSFIFTFFRKPGALLDTASNADIEQLVSFDVELFEALFSDWSFRIDSLATIAGPQLEKEVRLITDAKTDLRKCRERLSKALKEHSSVVSKHAEVLVNLQSLAGDMEEVCESFLNVHVNIVIDEK